MPALSRNKVNKVKSKFKCPVATSTKINTILVNNDRQGEKSPELVIPLTNDKLDKAIEVIDSQQNSQKKTLRKTPSISLTLSQSRSELNSETLNGPKVKAAYFDFIEQLSTSSSSQLTSTPQNSQRNRSNYNTDSKYSNIRDINLDSTYTADFPTPSQNSKRSKKAKKDRVNVEQLDTVNIVAEKRESQLSEIAVPTKARKVTKKKANVNDIPEYSKSQGNNNVSLKNVTIRKEKVSDNVFSKENFVLKKPAKEYVGKRKKSIISKKSENHLKGQQPYSSKNEKPKKNINTKQKSINKQLNSLYDRMKALQACRNVGLYAVCDRCDKARFMPHIKDPLELPPTWFCHMNPDDEHNNCEAPEDIPSDDQDYLINNAYNAGSIVWAKIDGYPYWPAMVEDDPDYEQYYWLEKNLEPTQYHVTFFDSEQVTRAWLHTEHIKPFKTNLKMYRKQKLGNKYHARIKAAIQQAEEAANMSLIDRLDKYSFIERYPKGINDLKGVGEQKTKKKKAKKQKDDNKMRRLHQRTLSNASSTVSQLGRQIDVVLGEMGNSDTEMSLDMLQNLF